MKPLFQRFAVSLIAVSLSASMVTPARALEVPPFPSCADPAGGVKAYYSSGSHGIVGKTGEYTGSDTVYQYDSQRVLQCFCPDDGGSGIETKWFKAGDLSQERLVEYQKEGWVHIPDGSLWGLDAVGYLAKNENYECHNGVGGWRRQGQVLGLQDTGTYRFLVGTAVFFAFSLIGLIATRKLLHEK